MSRWPNFFIVGAPRAGTTSLYFHLKQHPDIYMPPVKEPHFFAQMDMAGNVGTAILKSLSAFRNEDNYLKLFEKAGTKAAAGEASAGYLFDEWAPMRIHEKAPQAKIAMVLRDPVDRAYSSYLFSVRLGLERQPFYDAIREDYARPKKVLGWSYLYVEHGLYHDQVKRYLDIFGPEHVRIYLYEDFQTDTSAVVEGVCAFLGVPFYDGGFFDPAKKHNTYGEPRVAVLKGLLANARAYGLARSFLPDRLRISLGQRLLSTKNSKPPLDTKAREFLRSVHGDDTLKLQGLIGRDLRCWLE